MQPPPLELSYVCRLSALEKERQWTLSADALSWRAENFQDSVPLSEIAEIRLLCTPTRYEAKLFRCQIRARSGKSWEWKSHHFAGFAQFEDRSPAYRDFVENLVTRVAAQNPACAFVGGTSWLSWLFNTLFLCGSLLVLAVVIFLMYTAIGWLVIVKFLVIAFLLPRAFRWIVRNKPCRFDPGQIPAALLPSE
jgi:hypothetical protein